MRDSEQSHTSLSASPCERAEGNAAGSPHFPALGGLTVRPLPSATRRGPLGTESPQGSGGPGLVCAPGPYLASEGPDWHWPRPFLSRVSVPPLPANRRARGWDPPASSALGATCPGATLPGRTSPRGRSPGAPFGANQTALFNVPNPKPSTKRLKL